MSIILKEKKQYHRQLHKFGGSSLANPDCYHRVANIIINNSKEEDIIVVSASGITTNQLINLMQNLDHKSIEKNLLKIINYQINLIENLLNLKNSQLLINQLNKDILKIKSILNFKITNENYAEIVGYGEIWSAKLMSAFLNQKNILTAWLDSRDFLVAENSSLPKIDENKSFILLKNIINNNISKRLVITGFICRDFSGKTMLLGRNGSDYSATQIGYLANVSYITIWSDVSGIYSADPKKVKNTFLLPLLQLDEANELARLAAPVLHTRTLQPISNSCINLQLKSSFNPNKDFTSIEKKSYLNHGAKIITTHENICIIEIFINSEKNFFEVNKKINSLIKKFNVYPLVKKIYQNDNLLKLCYTSEYIKDVFNIFEKSNIKEISIIKKKKGFSLIAIVGSNIDSNISHIIKFLKHAKKNPIEFICNSEKNISLVAIINGKFEQKTVQKIHDDLFCIKKRIGLVLFGIGNIGSRWLELFNNRRKKLLETTKYNFILSGVINSSKQLLQYKGIDFDFVSKLFLKNAVTKNMNDVLLWMKNHPFDQLIVLDITASKKLTENYLYFARNKFHLITANKFAVGDSNIYLYNKIKNTFVQNNCFYLYNATVGAGLPINYTIRDLCDSGDTIFSISGIFSGTLSWLFIKFDGSISFTELVKIAWEKGLTEPDPRIDLSGKDVCRKLVILAREAGYNINPDQVKVESIIPEEYHNISLEKFFHESKKLNNYILQKFKFAKEKKLVLRYIARFNAKNKEAKVGIEYLKLNHALSIITPKDNIFSISSLWYKENSLIIRGPGAGIDVTAGAIQSDINRLLTFL